MSDKPDYKAIAKALIMQQRAAPKTQTPLQVRSAQQTLVEHVMKTAEATGQDPNVIMKAIQDRAAGVTIGPAEINPRMDPAQTIIQPGMDPSQTQINRDGFDPSKTQITTAGVPTASYQRKSKAGEEKTLIRDAIKGGMDPSEAEHLTDEQLSKHRPLKTGKGDSLTGQPEEIA